jgi:hypothetical protein
MYVDFAIDTFESNRFFSAFDPLTAAGKTYRALYCIGEYGEGAASEIPSFRARSV